ncbi:RMD1 family protein [Fulvivirga lutea]|uniref:RMD1 family protein n=1 Tax=Fulvivirga lutea TaxID=2810512 RepID=A0A974ZZU9_9BACT|nr:RMD1 family protein [Fulvivirga lutea]QSE96546.1 RMD1 family protein [Fulvivirga lutea]
MTIINTPIEERNEQSQLDKALFYRAYSIADHIDIKAFKLDHPAKLIFSSGTELYYQESTFKNLYILSYGTLVFLNYEKSDEMRTIEKIKGYCEKFNPVFYDDILHVKLSPNEQLSVSFSKLTINHFSNDVNKIIMLNLAQSVTLDKYNFETEQLLSEMKKHTNTLQEKGAINLNQKDASKIIGRTLSTKNNIAENLYIIDTPDKTWDDEFINNLHKSLTLYFELTPRHRALENTIKIIEENLTIFTTFNHHKESSRLEWIIIILIVIEVLDTLISKVL